MLRNNLHLVTASLSKSNLYFRNTDLFGLSKMTQPLIWSLHYHEIFIKIVANSTLFNSGIDLLGEQIKVGLEVKLLCNPWNTCQKTFSPFGRKRLYKVNELGMGCVCVSEGCVCVWGGVMFMFQLNMICLVFVFVIWSH